MRFFSVPTIGSRIKHTREQMGLDQTELADAVGTTQQTISKIESTSPSKSKYYHLIAKELDIDLNWLIEGVGKPSDSSSNEDMEQFINVALEALTDGILSVKQIAIKRGDEKLIFDPELLKKAFEINIRGKLTGDYTTAALTVEMSKKA